MSVVSAMILLILVMDPVGNIPVFMCILKEVDPKRRRTVLIREMLIALMVLIVFLFTGRYILQILHVSQQAMGIAGGIIIFMIALKMIFSGSQKIFKHTLTGEPFIVPLAVPLVAGPSAMTVLTLQMAREPDKWPQWLLALICAWALSGTILVMSENLSKFLGEKGMVAIERLMGMLLTTVAVEMLISGITQIVTKQ